MDVPSYPGGQHRQPLVGGVAALLAVEPLDVDLAALAPAEGGLPGWGLRRHRWSRQATVRGQQIRRHSDGRLRAGRLHQHHDWQRTEAKGMIVGASLMRTTTSTF